MPMLDIESALAFKLASEEKWRGKSLDDTVWGFQLQMQTRWNPGLPDKTIAEYETALDALFPEDFRTLLKCMNGTDLPIIDIRGSSGEAYRYAPGFYAYPRDFAVIKERIERVSENRVELASTLREQGYSLPKSAKLIPIFSHRYLVCSSDPDSSTVLSIWDASDAIVYGKSLKEYLDREVLS